MQDLTPVCVEKFVNKASSGKVTRMITRYDGVEQTYDGWLQEQLWGRPVSACGAVDVVSCTASLFAGGKIPDELNTVVHKTLDGSGKIIGLTNELSGAVPVQYEFVVNFASATLNLTTAHNLCSLACEAKTSLGGYK